MSADCCDTDTHHDDSTERPWRLWQVRELQLAATAGLLVAAGFVVGWLGSQTAELVLHGLAALAGGAAFVPDGVRAFLRRRLGVRTPMTIPPVGAPLLGPDARAALPAVPVPLNAGLGG